MWLVATRAWSVVGIVASLLALVGELAKRQFLLELAAEGAVLGDQVAADLTECLARGHRAIGLDANQDLRDIRVSNFRQKVSFLVPYRSRGSKVPGEESRLLLYPAMRTWGSILRCSLIRLPMVWSSFNRRKSDVLDMPGV